MGKASAFFNLDKLFVLLQQITPQHLLSRLVGRLADCRVRWIKDTFIGLFVRFYPVNMDEAVEEHPLRYASFNAFFTRALKAEARPIAADPDRVVCPVDGKISQLGKIDRDRIFQAKGHNYNLTTLLGGDPALAEHFVNGHFATIYLAPHDYHRVHMPVSGELRSMVYVPGELYSVNPRTAREVPELFARNERLVTVFDTPFGPMAMVLVGAMIVAGIETVWSGQEAPPPHTLKRHSYGEGQPGETVKLDKGEEMGRFKLGSTVVLLFGEDAIEWLPEYVSTSRTRLGEAMAQHTPPASPGIDH